MVHGRTFYRCGCLRFVCPCHPLDDSMRMTLNDLCPKHGGPEDPRAAIRYELDDDGRVRKAPPLDTPPQS